MIMVGMPACWQGLRGPHGQQGQPAALPGAAGVRLRPRTLGLCGSGVGVEVRVGLGLGLWVRVAVRVGV